jgi:hypothetical protein
MSHITNDENKSYFEALNSEEEGDAVKELSEHRKQYGYAMVAGTEGQFHQSSDDKLSNLKLFWASQIYNILFILGW